MILYCAADLIWATKIRATAEAAGVASRPARDVAMLEARLADSPVRGVLVDLEAAGAMVLVRRLRGPEAGERERAIGVLAFGPHVEVERFREAKEAGAERVMTRGALERRLAAVVAEMDGGERRV